MLRGQSDAWCGTVPLHTLPCQNDLVQMSCSLPGRGSGTPHAFGDTNPTLLCLCPAHVFFSSQLTLCQSAENRGSFTSSCSMPQLAHSSFPPIPAAGIQWGKTMQSLPTQMHLHKHCTGAPQPGRAAGRTTEKKRSPRHHHTMSRLLEEALESGTGHGGKLTRRCQRLSLQGILSL